ncbi:MAG: group II intron reverse transcriptase/maturase [Gemmatimonadetes bacterium]|nr:group II intron reverse transcriptase/maturase [Gemmatimonadota bacterium]
MTGTSGEDAPVEGSDLMERVLEAANLRRALGQVRRNGGAPGIDGMTVEDLADYLRKEWPSIRASLLAGTYKPQAVRRVEIPKGGGGTRNLGVPVVLDRFIGQALLQVLQAEWDPTFSEHSYGFRPGRSAHQAVSQAQTHIRSGYTWVVDLDLEKFFDLSRVRKRVRDRRVLRLIHRFLTAGVLSLRGALEPTVEGTPQGAPLSPLLANLLLDNFDKELEKRGHRFIRCADDANIYVRSQQAGERVMASVTRFLEGRLKLKVNETKSTVDRPWNRNFLGFTFTRGRNPRRKVSKKAILAFKAKVRVLTRRTRGRTVARIVHELRIYILGWRGYYGFAEVSSPLRDLDKWIRRRLRCYHWKQWGRRGYRELRARGVSRKLAWNTAKSAHGPWRLSHSPALSFALPARHFRALGLPCLIER